MVAIVMLIHNKNIEELVFKDKKLMKQLPGLKHLFDQWLIGQRVPALRFLSQKSVLEMLEGLTAHDNIAILEDYFQDEVSLRTIDFHVARNNKIPLEELQSTLDSMEGFQDNFCLWRDTDHAYLSFWR